MNKLIGNFIQSNARVLDLGCGDGSLLAFLKKNNKIKFIGPVSYTNITIKTKRII